MNIYNIKNRIIGSKLIKGFIATIIGSGASKIVLVLATFVCSNLLGKMEFGELSFIRNTLNMILCICALNFSALCTKFTVEAKTSRASLHRLFLLFVFSLAVCCIIGLFLIITPEGYLLNLLSSGTVVSFFRMAGILLPLFMLQPLIEGVLRGLGNFNLIGILQTISSICYLAAVFVGIKLAGFNGALVGVLIYYALYSVASLFVLQYKYGFLNHLQKLKGFLLEISTLYTMILPLFVMSFIDAPVMWFAQVILAKSGSMGAVGSMTAMMQVRNLVMLIPTYFSNTYMTFAGELNSQKNYVDYYRQYQKFIHAYLYAGVGMFVLLSVFSQPILRLYGKDFMEDWQAMIWSNLNIPIILLIGLLKIDLMLKEHQRFLLYISIAWNAVWLISFYILNVFDVNPLHAFFCSQNLGALVFVLGLFVVYNKDKKIVYNEKKY